MRHVGIIATAVGTAKLHGQFATLQFTRASAVTCAFCRRIQYVQILPSYQGPPWSGTYFLSLLFIRLMAVLQGFCRLDSRGGLVRNFCIGVYFFHGLSRTSTRLPMFY